MEPINYRRAILRRWPLILASAVICAVVVVLVPIKSSGPTQAAYQATALAGVPPSKGTTSTTSTSLDQLKFFAEQEQVYVDTAKLLHLKKGSGGALRKDISLKAKKGLPSGSIDVLAKQPTKQAAAKLANTFVKELALYADQQLASQYKASLTQAQANATSLAAQLANVQAEIAQLTKKPSKKTSPGKKSTPPTTTTTAPTTTTTVPPTTTTTAPTTTTSTTSTTTTTSSSTTSTTTHTSPIRTTTTIPSPPTTDATPTTAGIIVLMSKSGSTSTTSKTTSTSTPTAASRLEVLEAQETALKAEYTAAQSHLQQLTAQGAPQSGFMLLQAALPGSAKFVPASSNLLAHRSVRGGLGLLVGVVLGIVIALLIDGFDRRLRQAARTSIVFGLPVIAEIPRRSARRRSTGAGRPAAGSKPKHKRGRKDAIPVLDPVAVAFPIAVVDTPASLVAEAYRRLRISVMFSPATAEETDGAAPVASERANGYRPTGADAVNRESAANGGAPGAPDTAGQSESSGSRDVILVTSPSTEPTESQVVLNLAAAYAEAGERVLVVSTTDLRSNGGPAQAGVPVRAPVQAVHAPAVQVPAGGVPESPTQQLPVVPSGVPRIMSDPPTEPVPAVSPAASFRSHGGRDAVTVEEVVTRCVPQRVSGVSRLQLGDLLRGPGELATRGNEIISAARQIADVVIVEAPAVLGTPDAEALVRSVDAVIVVAESYCTTVSQARRSGELLRRVAAPTLGVVLTEVEMSRKELKTIGASVKRSA